MIISHKYKFIFLHARKCAGSSIQIALNKYLGPNDIQIGSWNETLSGNGKMNRKAIMDTFFSTSSYSLFLKKFLVRKLQNKKMYFSEFVNSSIKRCYQNKLGLNPDCPTADLVMRFDPNSWKNYFKFAFVRNPFDRFVSAYSGFTQIRNMELGHFDKFCEIYKLSKRKTYNALKTLESHGILVFETVRENKLTIQFLVSNKTLQSLVEKDTRENNVTKAILRTYEGVFGKSTRS